MELHWRQETCWARESAAPLVDQLFGTQLLMDGRGLGCVPGDVDHRVFVAVRQQVLGHVAGGGFDLRLAHVALQASQLFQPAESRTEERRAVSQIPGGKNSLKRNMTFNKFMWGVRGVRHE